jgi:hypothetical protein
MEVFVMVNERYLQMSMKEIVSKLNHLFSNEGYQHALNSGGEENYKKSVIELVNALNATNFEEEKIEQAIKNIIQNSKQEFMEVIRLESDLDAKQKQAMEILRNLKSGAAHLSNQRGLDTGIILNMRSACEQLSYLTEKEGSISQAIDKVSKKLDALIRVIRKEE